MLKPYVLASVLVSLLVVAVISAPLDQPRVRVKRSEVDDAVVDTQEKRSDLGYEPENVKQAQEDRSAQVDTEVTPTEPDVISDSNQQPSEESQGDSVPAETDTQSDDDVTSTDDVSDDSPSADDDVTGNDVTGNDVTDDDVTDAGHQEDLTDSEEEADLEKLISMETNQNEVKSGESDEPSEEEEYSSPSTPGGRYSKLLYELYNSYGYGRRRRAAGVPGAGGAGARAVTAEDMVMGGGGAGGSPVVGGTTGAEGINSGRRIKRDLAMDEDWRRLLKRSYMDEYPEYTGYEEAYPDYPYEYEGNDIPNDELLEEEYEYPEQYAPEELDGYYDEPNQGYPGEFPGEYQGGIPGEYPGEEGYLPAGGEGYYPGETEGYYPEPSDLTPQQKLALMSYLERKELENEGYNQYGGYQPSYPDVEETYEDLGPAPNQVYKRQYLSFVPGIKRSYEDSYPEESALYPREESLYPGQEEPLYPAEEPLYPGENSLYPGEAPVYPGEESLYSAGEEARNAREYERLMRLAALLNGPEGYGEGLAEEWRKK